MRRLVGNPLATAALRPNRRASWVGLGDVRIKDVRAARGFRFDGFFCFLTTSRVSQIWSANHQLLRVSAYAPGVTGGADLPMLDSIPRRIGVSA